MVNRNDDKTVNVIAETCFHPVTKIKVTGLKFFLGSNEDEESGSSSEVCHIIGDSEFVYKFLFGIALPTFFNRRMMWLTYEDYNTSTK